MCSMLLYLSENGPPCSLLSRSLLILLSVQVFYHICHQPFCSKLHILIHCYLLSSFQLLFLLLVLSLFTYCSSWLPLTISSCSCPYIKEHQRGVHSWSYLNGILTSSYLSNTELTKTKPNSFPCLVLLKDGLSIIFALHAPYFCCYLLLLPALPLLSTYSVCSLMLPLFLLLIYFLLQQSAPVLVWLSGFFVSYLPMSLFLPVLLETIYSCPCMNIWASWT